MMKVFANKLVVLSLIALFFTVSATAENMKKSANLNIHYIALGSTFLTPEIAKAYDIERSRYNGLVNISVLDNSQPGTPAQSVTLTGQARNNVGQFKSLEFTEVKEGDAIYYLAQVNYANEETIHFDINIVSKGKQHQLKFSQTFYVD